MSRVIELFYIFFQGVVLFQALIFGVIYFIARKKDILFYGLFLLAVAAYFFINAPYTFFGIPEETVWDSVWYDYVNTPVIIGVNFFYLLFHQAFFSDLTSKPVVARAFRFTLWLMPALLALFIVLTIIKADRQFIYYIGKVVTIFPAIIVSYVIIREKLPYYRLIAAGLISMILGTILTARMDYLFSEGRGSSIFATTYPFFFVKAGLLAEMIFYLIALLKKWNLQQKQLAVQQMQSQLAIKNMQNEISKQLHDDVGSVLSGIQMYAYMARTQLSEQKNNETADSLKTIHEASLQALDRLKDIVWFNNHEQVHTSTLLEKLKEYVMLMTNAAGIKVIMEFSSAEKNDVLDGSIAGHVYLIGKEAINNAVKYSEAKHIFFTIHTGDHPKIFIEIKDDGKGFEQDIRQGFGLANMKKRAAEINAILEISSQPGKGTAIKLYRNA